MAFEIEPRHIVEPLPRHIREGYYVRFGEWDAVVKSIGHHPIEASMNKNQDDKSTKQKEEEKQAQLKDPRPKDARRIEIQYTTRAGLTVTGTFGPDELKPLSYKLPAALQKGQWLNIKGVKHQVTDAYIMRKENGKIQFVFESRLLQNGNDFPLSYPPMVYDAVRMTRMGPSEVRKPKSIVDQFDREAMGRGKGDHRGKAAVLRSHARFVFR